MSEEVPTADLARLICNNRRLEGKVAIVTGGAAGIGEAIVRLFVKHGAKVIIADIADEAGKRLSEELGIFAAYVHCDVTKEEDVSTAVDLAIKIHGSLDIMYNNAGTVHKFLVDNIAEYDMEEFDRVMNVNVRGVMLGIKHAARGMIPNKRGCIISTASMAGVLGGLTPCAYTASKHAVIGLTKNGAAELGKHGIRVNSVSPSFIATALTAKFLKGGGGESSITEEDMLNVERFANTIANLNGPTLKAEDIAEAGLYLASEEAKYVSGHNLVVDGGLTVVNHSMGLYRSKHEL
eukprot:Gb_09953 [translate_table: standard]